MLALTKFKDGQRVQRKELTEDHWRFGVVALVYKLPGMNTELYRVLWDDGEYGDGYYPHGLVAVSERSPHYKPPQHVVHVDFAYDVYVCGPYDDMSRPEESGRFLGYYELDREGAVIAATSEFGPPAPYNHYVAVPAKLANITKEN